MKKIVRNRIIVSLAFAAVMVCGAFVFGDCAKAATIIDQGTCGENVTWTVDSDGLMTISGEGAMTDYGYSGPEVPWEDASDYVTSIVVEPGVTHIGELAFAHSLFNNLVSASLPDSLQSIGEYAFDQCFLLSDIELPAALKSIGRNAFAGCNLSNITIPESVETIGAYAFYNSHLNKVVIENPDTVIGEGAFEGNSLTDNLVNGFVVLNGVLVRYFDRNAQIVNVPAGVKRIDNKAFGYREGWPITTVYLPDGLEEIGKEAFLNCYYLSTIELPETVRTIGEKAFAYTALTSINIPEGIRSIEPYTFAECRFESVTIPESVETIGDFAFSRTSLKNITIPESVKTIGKGEFYYCQNLESVTLPSGLENLGDWLIGNAGSETTPVNVGTVVLQGKNLTISAETLKNCAVDRLVIGKGVTKLGSTAFANTTASNIEVTGDITSLPGSGLGLQNMNSSVTVITDKGKYSDFWFKDQYPDCTYKYNIGVEQISVASCVYDGTPQTPTVTIAGLTEGEDFTVAYENNTEIGTGKAIITGTGSYVNTVEKEFAIERVVELTHIPAIAPTCETAGNIEYWKDEVSGNLYADEAGATALSEEETVLPALEHIYGASVVEPTCTQPGYTLHVCGRCSDTYTDSETEATGHSFGEWEDVDTATCTTFGSQKRVCSACGCAETRGIDKMAHSYVEGKFETIVEATCTTDGSEAVKCEDCGTIIVSRVIPATGHKFEEWEVQEPTCTESGLQTSHCAVDGCDGYVETVLPALGHQWADDFTTDKESTCTEAGSKSVHCQRDGCTVTKYTQTIPASGHKFGEWIETKAATCKETGMKERTCTAEGCGKKEEVEIPVSGHQWGEEFVIDKEPTCTEAGSKSIHCKNCTGTKYTLEIPALGHKYESKVKKAQIGIAGKSWKECSVCHAITGEKTLAALKPAATKITSLTAVSKGFSVKWSKKSYTGYQIRYSLKSSMASSKTVTIAKAATVSKKITKLKAKKKYYVQVRTYKTVNGKKWCSAWCTKKAVTTKK